MNPVFAEQYGAFEAWHWWFRGRVRILSTVLRRELGATSPMRIASVGCGPLSGLEWLVPFLAPGGRVIGIDADVRHARDVPDGCSRPPAQPRRFPCARNPASWCWRST